MTLGVLRERPTAALSIRDMSGSAGRASAAADGRGSLAEDVLIAGRVKAGQTGSDHPAWRGPDASKHAGRMRAQRLYPDGAPCAPLPPAPFELNPLEPGERAPYEGLAMVTHGCVCGGEIAAANNPGMIAAAVSLHNAGAIHHAGAHSGRPRRAGADGRPGVGRRRVQPDLLDRCRRPEVRARLRRRPEMGRLHAPVDGRRSDLSVCRAAPPWLADDVMAYLVEVRIIEVVRELSYRIVGLKTEREGRVKGNAIGGKKRADQAERDEQGRFIPTPSLDPADAPATNQLDQRDPALEPAISQPVSPAPHQRPSLDEDSTRIDKTRISLPAGNLAREGRSA